jgi:UDP-N-acetylmuramate-alanine ligase
VHLLGGHNNGNASLAYATLEWLSAHYQKIQTESIQELLETHQGISRRAEYIGNNAHHVPIFSDYGHHPHEIKSTLSAFQEKYPNKRITCVFEPHQARRLMSFWDGFKDAFLDVSCLVVPIYSAREELSVLKQDIAYVQNNKTLFQDVTTVADLGNLFASESKSMLVADRNDLPAAIASISDGLIVCFSAGILDEKIRKIVKVESGELKVENG